MRGRGWRPSFPIGSATISTGLPLVSAFPAPAPIPMFWLPVLFWLTPAIVSWGAVNNMLENTQALWTTTAVLLMLAATRARTPAAMTIRSAGAEM